MMNNDLILCFQEISKQLAKNQFAPFLLMCCTANNIQVYVRKCHTIDNCYDDSLAIWHTLNEKVKNKKNLS